MMPASAENTHGVEMSAATTLSNRFRVERLSGGSLGAEITGITLSPDMDDATVAALRRIWLDHGVVFFRDQDLPPAQFLGVARRFGEVVEYPFVKGLDGFPEITPVVKLENDRHNFGGVWHSDTTYLDEPPMGSMLYALDVPPQGGDTIFANQYAAYDTLSDGMKHLIANLRAVHSDRRVAGPQAGMNAHRSTKVREDAAWRETVNIHPVVRTHPETGRKCLFVNHSYCVGFEGMTEAESRPLLDFLMDHGHRPEFTCRFRWEKGSIAFWDNRSTKHLAVNDSHTHRRHMRRVQIAGDRPV